MFFSQELLKLNVGTEITKQVVTLERFPHSFHTNHVPKMNRVRVTKRMYINYLLFTMTLIINMASCAKSCLYFVFPLTFGVFPLHQSLTHVSVAQTDQLLQHQQVPYTHIIAVWAGNKQGKK